MEQVTTMAQAMQLHAQILKSGQLNNPQTQTRKNLTNLFTFTALSPNGNLNYAHQILNNTLQQKTHNSFYHNTMIRAYAQQPDPIQSLVYFLSLHKKGQTFFIPDKFTYPFLLKSCTRVKNTHFGVQLHGLVLKSGFGSDMYVQHALIYMYCEFGDLVCGFKVFDKMFEKNVVSFTLMINGFVDNDCSVEAVKMFDRMMIEGSFEVNDATVVAVLRASADIGALGVGKRVNKIAVERGICRKVNVRSSLIDMYAKCGYLEGAISVFNDDVENVNNNVFTWTAMISGYASHGRYKDAIDLYERMASFDVIPDERTMTAVLSACRSVGLVNEGYAYFESMQKKYGLKPTIQHYGCIVDLYSRAGRLNEAEEFVRTMPIKPDAVLWRTLIWASKEHGDFNRAERLMKQLEKEHSNTDCGSYVLIGNVYASAGKWYDKARVRKSMNQKGLVKPLGSSKIEIDGVIHEFAAGDSSHVEAKIIYEKLEEIEKRLREDRYSPNVSEVLLEIDDDEKAFQLLHHSEKLAVSYGLIKTKSDNEIRIVKNLRSCEDCHNAMKLISKIYRRTIIVRDRIRFHCFINGDCSCKDYW